MMAEPDFFIVGAPKCGTTSLATWLSDHPDVFLCNPKEPHYYSPELVTYPAANTPNEYQALFSSASPRQRTGEASTGYLRSRVAIPQILLDQPDARMIVCLRNPVDMVKSVHAQRLKTAHHGNRDLEEVWRLQESCLFAGEEERYSDICRLGEQVERLLAVASREQVLFLLLEDLHADPRSVYKQVLGFIGVEDDSRSEFPVKNARTYLRSLTVAKLRSKANRLKQRIGISRATGIGRMVARMNQSVPAKAPEVSPELEHALHETFRPDIERLEALVGRDLRHWHVCGRAGE